MFRFFRRNREAVKKYLLIFFLSIVSIGMVITLAPIPGGDTSRLQLTTLAEIGGETISSQDLQQSVQSRLQGMGLHYDPRMVPAVASKILDDMVLGRALRMEARKMGLEVTQQEVLRALQAIPFLYSNGAFIGMDRYQDIIQQQTGMSVSQFEAQVRENVLEEKMRGTLTDGVQAIPQEVREEFLRRNAQTRIEYILFDPAQFVKAVQVTPGELEAFFKKDLQRYKVAEKRRARYVLIDSDHVRSQVKLSDDDLKQYYRQHLGDYHVPDRVKVAHILFKTMGKNPEEIVGIEKTARDVLGKIKSGTDFAEMAKKYSEDSTASKGGDLGWIVHGQTVKEFEEAAFSLKPGQVSDLIRTTYGLHILKVFEKQEAHIESLEEVKNDIRAALEKHELDAAQESLGREIHSQLSQNQKGFEEVARKYGLEVRESPLFKYNQAVPDLGSGEAFENLTFQLELGKFGIPITVPKGLAIIQVTEIVPEHLPKLDEVRALVEQDYRAEQSKVLVLQKAREFAAKSKTVDFNKVARSLNLTVKESKDFTEQDYVEGLGSGSQLAAAFTLALGQTSDVVSVGANSVVFRVVSHTSARDADLALQQDQIAEELQDRKRTLVFEIYQQNLKQQLLRSGELKINDAAMKQFLASYQRQ